jgi:hypothetical protein
LLRKLYQAMVKDLNPKDHNWFADPRNYTGPGYLYWKPYDYKVMRQLQHMFKRVLLTSDPSFETLQKESLLGFLQSQESFGLPEVNSCANMVIERARDLCHKVLGEFEFHEFSKLCAFGKRAARELPARESHLDQRVRSLGGSLSQQEWFKAILCYDIHLHRACRRAVKTMATHEYLKMTAVPKSFKSARVIAPDTILGGFLSRGLGTLIRKRLEQGTHIRLASQQDRHQELALRASKDGYLATIDMSKASDSFVWEHVEALVPESWHDILKTVRTDTIMVSELPFQYKSYMLMGSGHTFPLQTLLFYCIVKAVVELAGSKGTVDVYGDDILFPASYSTYVVQILHSLGFTVNLDKSFTDGPFRESCGGDYHTGIDVRPFMPEHVCGYYRAHEYTTLLHLWANGLLRRWSYEEVSTAYDLILNEILSVSKELCEVPVNETETAGLYFIPDKYSSCASYVTSRCGLPAYKRLVRVPKKRVPKLLRPYYWYKLWTNQAPFVDQPYDLKTVIRDVRKVVKPVWLQDPVSLLDKNQQEVNKGRPAKFRWEQVPRKPRARK